MYSKEEIEAERIRRANLKQQAISNAVAQSSQPREMPQEIHKENPFMSGVTGFNTAFERPVQGLMQLFAQGNWEGLNQTARKREEDFARSQAANPKSTMAGNILGDIGLGLPFGLGANAAVAKLAPSIGRSPVLTNILGGGLAGAALGGAQDVMPDESRLENAATGGLVGGTLGGALPIAARGLKAGYSGLRKFLGREGKMVEDFLENFSEEEIKTALKNQKIAESMGIKLTPAEAAQSKIASKVEGRVGTSKEGERKIYDFKEQQKKLEQQSIEDVLGKISPDKGNSFERLRNAARKIISKKEKALAAKARPHYEAAENVEIEPTELKSLIKDGNIKRALKDVLEDERYSSDIEGFAPNSIKVLDAAKKRIDGELGVASRSGDKNLVRVLRASKEKLLEVLDEVAPEYKKARAIYSEESPLIDLVRNRQIGKIADLNDTQIKQVGNIIFDSGELDNRVVAKMAAEFGKENPEAWANVIRNYMEGKLATSYEGRTGYHGTNFYNQFLANKKTYDKLQTALTGNKEAQETLKGMKEIFKDIINKPTPKGEAARSASHVDISRNYLQEVGRFISNLTGGHYDKAMVDILTTDKWQKAFQDVVNKSDKREQAKGAMKLFEKVKALPVKKGIDKGSSVLAQEEALRTTATKGPFMETENYEFYD